jgi:hypothetical protein
MSAAVLCGVTVNTASALNPNFAAGDLVVYFEQSGGTNTFMVDLGAAYTFRNLSSNLINITNIGSDLNAAFGPGTWQNDSSVFWGAAGVRSSSTNLTTVTNGDTNRTLYVSKSRTAAGTEGIASSGGISVGSDSFMTTGANGMIAQNGRLGSIPASATDRLSETVTSSNIDNQNPFTAGNPGTAFGIFPGGVMSSFGTGTLGTIGGVTAESALDLYRVLASTSGVGQVGGTLRGGDFQGSLVVDNTGNVSFIVAPVAVPEPTTMGATLVLGCVAGAMRRRRRETVQA